MPELNGLFPIRSNVQDFAPYVPGLSIEEIQEKYKLNNVIKMASNENPLGVSPLVKECIARHASYAFRYTPSGTPRLVKAIAEFLQLDEDRVVAGNGSDEIIDLIIRACPTPGVHNIVACNPSFSMYKLQAKLCDVEFKTVDLNPDFSFNWQGLLKAVDKNTAVVFITTPDNPSGFCPNLDEVRNFARKIPKSCLLVIDEAYIEFCDDPKCGSLLKEIDDFENIAILRTFSKIFGLAGLRLGYGVLPKRLATALKAIKAPFSVNILAEEAGICLLKDTPFIKASYETVIKGRIFLREELTKLSCMVYPSQTNFIMFKLPENAISAHSCFERLLENGIIIRPLKSYGLPDHLRVSIGTKEENLTFINKLKEILNNE